MGKNNVLLFAKAEGAFLKQDGEKWEKMSKEELKSLANEMLGGGDNDDEDSDLSKDDKYLKALREKADMGDDGAYRKWAEKIDKFL